MTDRPALLCTYRLQLGPHMGFAQALELVPYLRELGVSHLYLSPILQARSGSSHGYDVVDPRRISEDLGGEEAFRALAGAGLGVIQDIVPNHMSTSEENPWWSDPAVRERWFDLDPAGGYRRFFDIDDMAAIRQEDEEVFATSHEKILELVREGVIDGLRVDHPDGLADPAGYLRRLREQGAERVWVEKILHPGEPLRQWPVSGTVGYEFLNDATALFTDPAGRMPLTELLAEFTGESRSFEVIALQAQLEQAEGAFRREVARLARLAPFSEDQLARALAGLPVYRTYVEPAVHLVEQADRQAVAAAGMDEALGRALLLEDEAPAELVTRFQQTSPAIAAKGVEDTAFYRYLRLLSLNEVGGDPARFGMTVADFHAANLERAERFPEGLLVTQTHDTKRSGDVRARLGVLSEIPGQWRERVLRWSPIADGLRSRPGAPDRAQEYLLYQTLLGAWPIERERLEAYLVKAMREAKLASNWAEPDEAAEAALLGLAGALLDSAEFMADFVPFAERVAVAGERSSLAQLLLKLTVPGVPDVYQGDELWRLSLVDPDNRRPVDWARRREALRGLEQGAAPTRQSAKLELIRRALQLRRRQPGAFAGAYLPLPADPGVCAFMRGDEVLVAVLVRGGSGQAIADLPGGLWREARTGCERRLEGAATVGSLCDGDGLALYERMATG
jgi:(1->4)-alpha-D-glucan 1-alpha-D-glucosylmutase